MLANPESSCEKIARGGLVYVLFFAALGALSHTPAQYFDNIFGLRLIALPLHLVEQGLYDVSICPFHGPMMPQNRGRDAGSKGSNPPSSNRGIYFAVARMITMYAEGQPWYRASM